mgnify:CR=1 FL=1
MAFAFTKAERKKAKLRLALCGPSGSGKTFSSLLIAKGIGGRVAMIDTERGSGELYADNPKIGIEYFTVQFTPPYTPQRAIEAIKAAQAAGFDVVIFDSLSHVWMGEGGMLEMVDMAAKGNRGNSFAGWKEIRPHEKKFLDAITGTDIHIIATMRTKTAWEVEKDDRGRNRPVKVGLKPEQREGIEYEFTLTLDLAVDGHVATASKDRTDLFMGTHFVPGEETGRQLIGWFNSAKDIPAGTGQGSTTTPAEAASAPPQGQDKPAYNDPLGAGVKEPGAGQNATHNPPAQSPQGTPRPRTVGEARTAIWNKLMAEVGNDPEKAAVRLSELADGVCRAEDLIPAVAKEVWNMLNQEQGK